MADNGALDRSTTTAHSTQHSDVLKRPVLVPVVVASAKLWQSKGLQQYFSQKSGFILLEGSAAPDQLLTDCRRLAPCVLIADAALLEPLDAAEFASAVYVGRAIQVLVYGAKAEEPVLEKLVRMGCMGALGEGVPPRVLSTAVRAVARGEMWFGRRFLTRMLQELLFATSAPRLTARERTILQLIAQGYNNRAIAGELCMSRETVRWHIRRLNSKLGNRDRMATALFASKYLDDSDE